MLMHTKGILVMTPESAMVLTGKQALDYSGKGLGWGQLRDRRLRPGNGAERPGAVLGAQPCCRVRRPDGRYDHTYIGLRARSRAPQRAADERPHADRDVSDFPHAVTDSDFATVGDLLGRAQPHGPESRSISGPSMRALTDQDHPVLERWAGMGDADTSGGAGRAHWRLAGLPHRHRVTCRCHAAASRLPTGPTVPMRTCRHAVPPLVEEGRAGDQRRVLWQPAAGGAREPVRIRRVAGVDAQAAAGVRRRDRPGDRQFTGPIVFCVISRYHGGAFVVFSKALNANMTVLALEGSFASVLGGAPGRTGRGVLRRGDGPHGNRLAEWPSSMQAENPAGRRPAAPDGPP